MLDRLHFILNTLGSTNAAASYLDYSTRQFYNIKKCLEQGRPLHKRTENYIVSMAGQLGYDEANQTERALENDQSEQPKQGQPDASIP